MLDICDINLKLYAFNKLYEIIVLFLLKAMFLHLHQTNYGKQISYSVIQTLFENDFIYLSFSNFTFQASVNFQGSCSEPIRMAHKVLVVIHLNLAKLYHLTDWKAPKCKICHTLTQTILRRFQNSFCRSICICITADSVDFMFSTAASSLGIKSTMRRLHTRIVL